MRQASIIALAVTACTVADNGDRAIVVRDSGGMTIVEGLHSAWNNRDAWWLSANPGVGIGAVEGDTHISCSGPTVTFGCPLAPS